MINNCTTWCVHQLKDNFIPHEGNNCHPLVLRHRTLWLYTALIFAVKFAVLFLSIVIPITVYLADITPANIISLTNEARQKAGLSGLQTDTQLTLAAQSKAKDMIEDNYFAHTSPDNMSPWHWIQQTNYKYVAAGENLAINFSTAEGVSNAWLASQSHKDNILNKNFQDIGVAVDRGNINGKYATIVVQMFGAKASLVQQNNNKVSVKPSTPVKAVVKKVVKKPVIVKSTTRPTQVRGVESFITPTIDSFDGGSMINSSRPTIFGQARPNSSLEIVEEGSVIGQAKVDPEGKYVAELEEGWSLGEVEHELWARYVGDTQETTHYQIVVDMTAPAIDKDRSFIIPLSDDDYQASIFSADDDIKSIVVTSNNVSTELKYNDVGLVWEGTADAKSVNGSVVINVLITDNAGNKTQDQLIYTQKDNFNSLFGLAKTKDVNNFLGIALNDRFSDPANKFYIGFILFLILAFVLDIVFISHRRTHWKVMSHLILVMVLAVGMMYL